jgi:hypothetical protein
MCRLSSEVGELAVIPVTQSGVRTSTNVRNSRLITAAGAAELRLKLQFWSFLTAISPGVLHCHARAALARSRHDSAARLTTIFPMSCARRAMASTARSPINLHMHDSPSICGNALPSLLSNRKATRKSKHLCPKPRFLNIEPKEMHMSIAALTATRNAKRDALETARIALRKAEIIARTAQGAARDERIEHSLVLSRGGPRPAPGYTPPPSALEIAAGAATVALESANSNHIIAETHLKNAEAALLAAENAILYTHRDRLAREFKEMERNGADPDVLAAKRSELRAITPPETAVRIHQRFTVSSLVREVLDEPTVGGYDLNTPVHILSGIPATAEYERLRAQILAEADTSPLEAA